VLAEAWMQDLMPTDRPHLVRALSAIVDGRSGIAHHHSADALEARAALGDMIGHRGLERHPSLRDGTGHPHAMKNLEALRTRPHEVPGNEGPAPNLNDAKRELFGLLQLFTNLVNDDVVEYVAGGGDLGAGKGNRYSLPPFQPETSSVQHPQWARPIARAAHLIRTIPSVVHEAAMEGATSDLEVVLANIAQGYGALRAEQHTIDAAKDLVLAHDPSTSTDDLRDILLRSKTLAVQKAGLNVVGLVASRDALSLPEEDEGTYEPTEREKVDASNLRYDPVKRRVTYRKPLSRFLVAKASDLYARAWGSAEGDAADVAIGDIVEDDMGATAILACPALTPLDRSLPAPVPDQWERLVVSNYRRWTELPHVQPTTPSVQQAAPDPTPSEPVERRSAGDNRTMGL
jgi:hypothetical protein